MRKKKKKLIIWTAFSVLLLAILCYAAYNIYEIYNPKLLFKKNVKNTAKAPITDQNKKTEVKKSDDFGKNKINILLAGLDYSLDGLNKQYDHRTDTLIVASIDFNDKKIDIISIPRDTYMLIPGFNEMGKINKAFTYGQGVNQKAFKNTEEAVSKLLGGEHIDYYVGVEMQMVINLVDHMGGLEYNVDVPVNVDNKRFINKGYQKLTGQQVLDYARHRNTKLGDIDRVRRQQKLLLAVFDKMKSAGQLMNLPVLYGDISKNMHTDLNIKQIASIGLFAKELKQQDFHMHSIKGYFLTIEGESFWGVDAAGRKQLVKDLYNIDMSLDQPDITPDPKYLPEQKYLINPEDDHD